jgi:hypothetical protein
MAEQKEDMNLSSSFASDYNLANSQNYVHTNHAAYLRSTMEKNLDAINHNIPRTSTVENEKVGQSLATSFAQRTINNHQQPPMTNSLPSPPLPSRAAVDLL